jgi:hypothetical protein
MDNIEIPDQKIAMIAIIMSLKNFTDPVAMQSISDAAMQRKEELERLNRAKKLWKKFSDVPINEDEEIDINWFGFTIGTPREDIWHWFEEEFDLSVATDLMGM